MKKSYKASALVAAIVLLAVNPASGQTEITWQPTGVDNWNVPGNWSPPFVPSETLGGFETAVITNGGTAVVDSTLENPDMGVPGTDPVAGVLLGRGNDEQGTLRIHDGGMLSVVIVTDSDPPQGGLLEVGQAGRGILDVGDNGTLLANRLAVGGAADSVVRLLGAASVDVATSANLARQTHVTGPDVAFNAGSLSIPSGALLISEITGSDHSALAADQATLGGALQLRFTGHAPQVGDSWDLIEAGTLSGQFSQLDTSQVPALPRGLNYRLNYNVGGDGKATLSVASTLILTVDRVGGGISIENAVGASVNLDGYTLQSAGGLLSVDDWSSLADGGEAGWDEILNLSENHLGELNLTGNKMVDVGQSFSLGSPYVGGPVRPSEEDLVFRYTSPSGEIVDGIVEYIGAPNDLVLRVDPLTGEAAIRNLSTFIMPEIDGYTIESAAGSLDPALWDSFADSGGAGAGWDEILNASASQIGELNLTASTLFATGTSISIGDVFQIGGTQDLVFQFTEPTGEIRLGTVEYGEIAVAGQPGDTNGDGLVNIDDLNAVRNNFGVTGNPNGTLPGDAFPFDGSVDIDDLNAVRNNFGAGAGAVPEPATAWLLMFGLAVPCAMTLRRR